MAIMGTDQIGTEILVRLEAHTTSPWEADLFGSLGLFGDNAAHSGPRVELENWLRSEVWRELPVPTYGSRLHAAACWFSWPRASVAA